MGTTNSDDKMTMMDTIGKRIHYLRESKGWTQERLATEANASKSFISEVENDRRNPSAEKLLDIASVLGASLDFIMTGKTEGTDQEAPRVIQIPRELAAAAEEKGWPYRHVMAILDVWTSVVARRNPQGRPEMSKKSWIELYEKLRNYLE